MVTAVDAEPNDPAENLRIALELFEAGESMYRQKLRRQNPEWSEEQIEQAVDDWLQREESGGLEHVEGFQLRPL